MSPPRKVSESKKKIVAGKQFYKCANKPGSEVRGLDGYDCPLWNREGVICGSFDESGYEIDHIVEHSVSGDDRLDNLQALCKMCHSVKTKRFMTKEIPPTKKSPKVYANDASRKVTVSRPIVNADNTIKKIILSQLPVNRLKQLCGISHMKLDGSKDELINRIADKRSLDGIRRMISNTINKKYFVCNDDITGMICHQYHTNTSLLKNMGTPYTIG